MTLEQAQSAALYAAHVPARRFTVSEASEPLGRQAQFDRGTLSAVQTMHRLTCGYSIKLDILQSTINAFKDAIINADTGRPLETYYVVNLLEAIDALVPDSDGFMDAARDSIMKVDELWRDVAVPEAAATPAKPDTRPKSKRARREATVGSAA